MKCNWTTKIHWIGEDMICKLSDIVNTANTGADAIKKAPILNEPTNLRCLRIGDVSQKRDFSMWGYTKTSKMDYERYKLHKGDSIIARTGNTIGVCTYIEDDIESVYNNGLIRLTAKTELARERFLFYLIRSTACQDYIQSIAYGTSTQPNMKIKDFLNFDIIVPTLEIQDKIIAIVDKIEKKIQVNTEINNNLQQQAASIFTKWLSTCADASTIGDMSYNILDYSPVGSEQIRLLNSSDITEGVFPIAPLVPNKDLKGHFKKRFKFGDILYSEIRPRNHHYGFVLFDASDYIASTRLMVIRAIENKVSPAMLYQYLLLPEVEAEFTLKTESRSGTFPQGNYADMASIRVPYSPTDSQVAISETLTQIRYTIAQNQLESQRLAELRDTLLPKLMSGELDVSAVEL